MSLVERYIFRLLAGAFLVCLPVLSGVIWITQALRQLDLVTAKGQTLLVFLAVSALTMPTLVAIISPIALLIAALYVIDRLHADSELIAMSAAGISELSLFRPFATIGALVSAAIALLTMFIMPLSYGELEALVTRVRADFITNIAQPGNFANLDAGVTFHYRERSGDALVGVFLQDRRDGLDSVYLAERGQIAQQADGSYLVLENGSVQRRRNDTAASYSVITFERYAVDLATLNQRVGDLVQKPRERSTSDLLFPDANEPYYVQNAGRFRSELHSRLSAWLLPLAYVCVVFVVLGQPRTGRRGRMKAIAMIVVAAVALRIAVFAAFSLSVRSSSAVILMYGIPAAVIMAACAFMFGTRRNLPRSREGHWDWFQGFVIARTSGLRRSSSS